MIQVLPSEKTSVGLRRPRSPITVSFRTLVPRETSSCPLQRINEERPTVLGVPQKDDSLQLVGLSEVPN